MIRIDKRIPAAVVAIGLIASLGGCPRRSATSRPEAGKRVVQKSLADVGIDGTALDRKADPCSDFYQFACGSWIKRTEIPGDQARWIRSFSEIKKNTELQLRAILEAEQKDASSALGKFYSACMNTEGIEKEGLAGLKDLFALIDSIQSSAAITGVAGRLHRLGVWPLFFTSSRQDYKDATNMIGHVNQGGIGLPDRAYYLRKGKRSEKLRARYVQHIERMLTFSGMASEAAATAAKQVMALETELAKVSLTRVERRDPKKTYNRLDRAGLEKAAPSFGWAKYFTDLGFPNITQINVAAPDFIKGVEALLQRTPPEVWRHYIRWTLLDSVSQALPKRFVDETFAMRQALTGQKKQRPRWKRCVAATDRALGDLLGKAFVERHFPKASKSAVTKMVLALSDRFAKAAPKLDWMGGKTLERALVKREKMEYLIGYPSKWRKYSFAIGDSYAANLIAARRFDIRRILKRIGKPVDRGEWLLSAPSVNAYYHPLKNHMVYPAGILQPPFFNPKATVAVNLGAMGMVVGHELTHGFDDKGSLFDGNGNLSGWWEKPVRKRFKARTACVRDAYSRFEVLPGVKVNGKLTLGENIADIGGLKLAYGAYRTLRRASPVTVVADGFTEDQQFFLSAAQLWCYKVSRPFARLMARIDTHSPPQFRVNGAMRHVKAFGKAFSCSAGSPMSPKKRCEVW